MILTSLRYCGDRINLRVENPFQTGLAHPLCSHLGTAIFNDSGSALLNMKSACHSRLTHIKY